MDFSNKTVLVIDNGLFVDLAPLLAKHYGKVWLWCPWANAYPKSSSLRVGLGLEGVEKIDDFWALEPKSKKPYVLVADLVVFPDLYYGALQDYLRSIGRRVWGSAMGEELELFRGFSKEHLKREGLSVGKYTMVTGTTALRRELEKKAGRYVKVSRTRGDMETFFAKSLTLVEPRIVKLEDDLGAWKEHIDIFLEDPIDPAVEVGYDCFLIDGKAPKEGMCGIEVKDKGYVGIFQPYTSMPQQIQDVNAKLEPTLRRYQYRNFWSAEARITKDGTPWVIDPCARWSSPCSEVQMMMYTNLPEILWAGAGGDVVTPTPGGKWAAELMAISSWANQHWQAVEFPAKLREHVKLHFPVVIDGKYYCTPQGFDLPAIGAVVAVGDTMQAAVEKCREIAKEVEGYYIETDASCFDEAEDKIKELKTYGITL